MQLISRFSYANKGVTGKTAEKYSALKIIMMEFNNRNLFE